MGLPVPITAITNPRAGTSPAPKNMPDLPQRKRLRLQGYDYSQAGAYFVTIVTQGRVKMFGAVVGDVMVLNPVGEIVKVTWARLPERFPTIALDEFIVMANHLHGIVWLRDAVVSGRACPSRNTRRPPAGRDKPGPYKRVSLPDVIRVFKSLTTREYKQRLGDGKLWQRGYHDRVIRSERELDDTRRYIRFNAQKWADDTENPEKTTPRAKIG